MKELNSSEKSILRRVLQNWQFVFLIVMLGIFFILGLKRGVLYTTGNDFTWHLVSGREALASAAGILNTPLQSHYSPGRVAFNAVLSYLPESTAKVVVFTAAWILFMLSLYLWNALAESSGRKVGRSQAALANAVVYLLMVFYIVRDLDDCGLQLILLSLLVIPAWLLMRGYRAGSGLVLALAVTWKSSPLLFLPFLLYKRQWKCSLALVAGIILFNTIPSLLLFGKGETVKQWVRIESMFEMSLLNRTTRDPQELKQIMIINQGPDFDLKDPRRNAVETARNQNQALKPALGRYLLHSDQSDPLFITTKGNWENNGEIGENKALPEAPEHPLWVQFFDLPVSVAGKIVTGAVLLLGLLVAWRFRKSWRYSLDNKNRPVIIDSNLPAEWAVACIFTVLLSPLCWLHHLVLLLPAMILIMREAVYYKKNWGIWRWCCLAFMIIPAWITERDFIGKELSIIALSYKFHTLAALLVILLVLTLKDRMYAE